MSRFFTYVEPTLHLALLGGATALAWTFWSSGTPAGTADGLTVHVDSSEVLASWRPADPRVFLFLSPTCSFCEESMGFYARLSRTVDSVRQAGVPVALAAVIDQSDSPPAQRRMLREAGVAVDTLLRLSSRSPLPVGVTGVPTVAIEEPGDHSPSAWEGLQEESGEREILSAVRSIHETP